MSRTAEATEGAAVPNDVVVARPAGPGSVARVPSLAPRAPASRGFRNAVSAALGERRLFVLIPFAIIAGLVVSLGGTAQPEPVALAVVAAGIAATLPVALRSTAGLRLLTLFAAFWLGYALLAIHGAVSGTGMLSRPAYGTYVVEVDQVLSANGEAQRVVVSALAPEGGARALPIRRARLVVGADPHLAPGDIVRAPIRFYPVPGPVVPGGFDAQFHSYFDGIGAYGTATGALELVAAGAPSARGRFIDGLRGTIGERIDLALAQPAAGIARALITGDQSAVPETARETMATAGLAHVLSVSGLHLTIVAGGVFALLRLSLSLSGGLSRLIAAKRVAAAGGIAAALFYFAISGGNVAALRATVMIVLVLGAVIVGRRALTMRNVAIAALVVILTDPASVFRPSFQLSFAAVVALIGAWELSRGREQGGRQTSLVGQALGYFAGIAVTSVVAGAATLLFSVYHFQQTSPLSVLGNLVSLPLVGFVMMPSAALAALAMPFGFEAPFLMAMGWSIDRMLDLAGFVAGLSRGLDASPLLGATALILGLVAIAWFAFLNTWHRLIGPVLLVPAIVLFGLDRPPDLLIADTTQAVAARIDGGLKLVAGKSGTFAVDVWQETYGEPIEPARIACDSIACIASSPLGFDFAIVSDPAGFFEECGRDLVITRRKAPVACTAGTVIDAEHLAAGGVHWLAWDGGAGRFEVRRAIPDRSRPWRPAL